MNPQLDYTLQLADNALILAQRLGEWCGHGPILEHDIALTNTALDHMGRARSLYQYAADQFNHLPAEEKGSVFTSVALQNMINTGASLDEDNLAFFRDGWDFKNLLLLEQPNNDWAYTIARSFFFDVFNYLFFTQLQKSPDESFAAIAEKSLKEVTYHMRWSSEWVVRLGDGTDESHARMQAAVNELWMYTGEMFVTNETDKAMAQQGTGVDVVILRPMWLERVKAVFEEATITLPQDSWMQKGGKDGRHSEHLGYILTDMQFVQRTYPGMKW